jgi:cell division protein FtsB
MLPPASPPSALAAPRRQPSPAPLRRKQSTPPPPSRTRGRLLNGALLFIAVVLTTDALIGEKGLMQTMRARQEAQAEESRLAELKQENARLREEKRRLNEDPEMIESEARQQLGLIRPGEVMFILKDVQPANVERPAGGR